jgi:hypothetical protein
MEYATAGDLAHYIKKGREYKKLLPEEVVWSYFIQVMRARDPSCFVYSHVKHCVVSSLPKPCVTVCRVVEQFAWSQTIQIMQARSLSFCDFACSMSCVSALRMRTLDEVLWL